MKTQSPFHAVEVAGLLLHPPVNLCHLLLNIPVDPGHLPNLLNLLINLQINLQIHLQINLQIHLEKLQGTTLQKFVCQ